MSLGRWTGFVCAALAVLVAVDQGIEQAVRSCGIQRTGNEAGQFLVVAEALCKLPAITDRERLPFNELADNPRQCAEAIGFRHIRFQIVIARRV